MARLLQYEGSIPREVVPVSHCRRVGRMLNFCFCLVLERTREVNQTNVGSVSKATLGKLMRKRRWSADGLFRAHIIPSCSELCMVRSFIQVWHTHKRGGGGAQCWGHLSIASVVFFSGSGQLLECLDCHHDLASYEFVKHGQARWLSLLFKTRSVQNAKHVVNTVGLLI